METPQGLDEAAVHELIERKYGELKHYMGWSLLYCPASVRLRARVATLGLNPGGGRDGGDWDGRRNFSDEVGNSYFVQNWSKAGEKTALQHQVAKLADLLGTSSDDLLSANLVPFRSPSWRELPNPVGSLEFGLSLLPWLLESNDLRVVVLFGLRPLEAVVAKALDAPFHDKIRTGWGSTEARFYKSDRLQLVSLPHLSRYQIFGRDEARELEERLRSFAAI
jgi:hypothetical protein